MTNYISLQNTITEINQDSTDKSIDLTNEDSAVLRFNNRRLALKKVRRYVISTIVIALFGAVYEYFSFGVFSYYMLYAFAFPLGLGLLPWLLIAMDTKKIIGTGFPQQMTRNLWGAGITTLTAGALFHGVLDIYGTTSAFSKCYFIVGAIMLLAAVMIFIGNKEKRETTDRI